MRAKEGEKGERENGMIAAVVEDAIAWITYSSRTSSFPPVRALLELVRDSHPRWR